MIEMIQIEKLMKTIKIAGKNKTRKLELHMNTSKINEMKIKNKI